MRPTRPPLLLALLLAAPPAALAVESGEFSGRVVGVTDGDTLSVMRDGLALEVRLHAIDAPEIGQPFGPQARQFASLLALGKSVRVQVRFADRTGRTLAEVFLPDGRSLAAELVRAGYAWHFTRHSTSVELVALEEEAREARRGLWVGEKPQPPWDFGKAEQPPPAPAAVPKPPIVGNRRSKVFHWPGCPGYEMVKPRNRVPFASSEEALTKGFRPARNCP